MKKDFPIKLVPQHMRHPRCTAKAPGSQSIEPPRLWRFGCFCLFCCILLSSSALHAVPLVAYDDQLRNSFQDWSWATHSMTAMAYVHSGIYSISFEPDSWQAVYLHRDGGISGNDYDALEFWIHGGPAGGQDLHVVFLTSSSTLADVNLNNYLPGGNLPPNTWVNVRLEFDAIGVGTQVFTELYFQDATGGNQATAYLDDIQFTERPATPLTLSVDPYTDRHAYSPFIYGANFNSSPASDQPPYTVNRWGGNSTTRYSWQVDVSNQASDWFFLNIANDTDVSQLPDNSTADRFIDSSRAAGSEPIMTMPIIGWTPFDRVTRWGFSVALYGPQEWTECTYTGWPPWCRPDAGNGIHTDGTPVTGNNPLDTSVAITPSFVTGWMAHIANRVGTAGSGGVRFFALDNEPMLWNSTHRDVHPTKVNYAEIWQRTQDYASAIKTQDPAAIVFGPVVWGWCAYFYSAADGCVPGSDYNTDGPFLEWYLQKVREYETTYGIRLVDYLDIHYYPQADNVALSDDESAGTAAVRLRSVKSLYDPAYTDESWIGQPVRLIPRMKNIIAQKAPGTKFAITEYNWGNDNGLTSALAQAEVLAVFAREGIDLATRWTVPSVGSRVEDAFKLHLNYDGAGARIAGDSVHAVSSRIDDVAIYGFHGPDARLYVLLFNKSLTDQEADVQVTGGITGSVQLWGFDAESQLAYMGTASSSPSGFYLTLPSYSVRLAVTTLNCMLPSHATNLRLRKSGSSLQLTWTNVSGATDYVIYEDASAFGSFATQTGSATDGSTGILVPTPSGRRHYLVAARNACGESPKK